MSTEPVGKPGPSFHLLCQHAVDEARNRDLLDLEQQRKSEEIRLQAVREVEEQKRIDTLILEARNALKIETALQLENSGMNQNIARGYATKIIDEMKLTCQGNQVLWINGSHDEVCYTSPIVQDETPA